MRALIKNVPGVLRVESPPFSFATYSAKSNNGQTILLRIQFAFDAIQAVKEGYPTVTLSLKRGANKALQKVIDPKKITLKESARAFDEFTSSNVSPIDEFSNFTTSLPQSNVIKTFKFDLLSAIPDETIQSLKNGFPYQYNYIQSVKPSKEIAQNANQSFEANDKEYFLSLISKGVDPASISENFPLPDPLTGRNDKHSDSKHSFYTKQVPKLNDFESRYVLSNFAIFEKEIEVTREEFAAATIYEFEYVGIAKSLASRSVTSVDVNCFEILMLMDSYEESVDQSSDEYFRRLDTYFAINPEPFSSFSPGPNIPAIVRKQQRLVDGSSSSKFSSIVTGKITSSNGKNSKSARQEPDIFPFYVLDNADGKSVKVLLLPPDTKRVEVLAREITRGKEKFQVITSVNQLVNSDVTIPISLPIKNSSYELRIKTYDSKSREIVSTNTVVYSNKNAYSGAQLNVSQPRRISASQSSISIAAAFTDSGRNDIIALIQQLTNAGISADVIGDISNESTLYSQIFSFRVETISLSTGKQTFSKELAPSSDSPSTEYIFDSSDPLGTVAIVSLGMKSPDSLVPTQAGYRFGKFGGLYRQSQPSAASISRNKKSGESFDYVDSGVKLTVFVSTQTEKGEIESITALKTMRKSVLLKWSYSGDISQVDHFQVFGLSGGFECLLGCSFKSMTFEDFVISGRVGVSMYSIRPVYVNMTVGPFVSVYQTLESSLPYILSENFAQEEKSNASYIFSNDQKTLQSIGSLGKESTKVVDKTSLLPRQLGNSAAILETPAPLYSSTNETTILARKNFAFAAPSNNKSSVNAKKIKSAPRRVTNARK